MSRAMQLLYLWGQNQNKINHNLYMNGFVMFIRDEKNAIEKYFEKTLK